MMAKTALQALVIAAVAMSAVAGPCSAGDVSITQDGVYTDVASTVIQTGNGIKEDKMAVFSAQFRLFCKNQALEDAALTASVVYRSGSEAYVAKAGLGDVAVMGNSAGTYQLSFALPEGQMPSGEYKAELFFAGDAKPVASISMFHSVPVVTGRHMEMATIALLGLQAYYVMSKVKAASA